MVVRLDSTMAPPSSTTRAAVPADVAHPEGQVGQTELVDRPALAGTEGSRLLEGQELNRGRALAG